MPHKNRILSVSNRRIKTKPEGGGPFPFGGLFRRVDPISPADNRRPAVDHRRAAARWKGE
jgi:hypothetical protein